MQNPKYGSTKEKTHAARVSRLIGDPCSDLFRDILRNHVTEMAFPGVLQREKSNLSPILNRAQRELLYPHKGQFQKTYEDFDLSLLYTLLRNISGINSHSKGWGKPPDPADRSISANIDRIREIRNTYCGHSASVSLSDQDFSNLWQDASVIIAELEKAIPESGTKYSSAAKILKSENMDPEQEEYHLAVIDKQNMIMEDLSKKQEKAFEEFSKEMAEMSQAMKEMKDMTEEKWKSKINQQYLPEKRGQGKKNMEKQNQAAVGCLEELLDILRKHGERDWENNTPYIILQELGLHVIFSFHEDMLTNPYIFRNLTNDVNICLKHLREVYACDKSTVNQCCTVSALCGTLITGKRNDVSQQRRPLVEVISEVQLTRIDKKPVSFLELDNLEDEIELKLDGDTYSFKRSPRNLQIETDDSSVKQAAAFFVVPLKQCELRTEDVSLTSTAVKFLQNIEGTMTSNTLKAKTLCMKFLKSYGSHYQLKEIQLGGIFEIEIVYRERNPCQSTEMRQKFIDQVLLSGHLCRPEGLDIETDFDKSVVEDFELISSSVYQYGGPQQVVNFPLWHKTLLECKQSWIILNKKRFETGDYMGIWALIERKCKSFKNAKDLANFVAEVWLNFIQQNDDKYILNIIESWKATFLEKRKTLTYEERPPRDDLHNLIRQLSDGEAKYGYTSIRDAMVEAGTFLELFYRKLMEFNPQATAVENHNIWHGLLEVANKYGSKRDRIAEDIIQWLRKHMLNEFVVLPYSFQDVINTSRLIKKIFLPTVITILKRKLCETEHDQAFFQFLTSTLEKEVSCALDDLLSAGKTQEYLAMYSDAMTLDYDIKTKKIKCTLSLDILQEYSWRCKKTRRYFEANASSSLLEDQAWALKNIVFHLIQDRKGSMTGSDSAAQDEKAKHFLNIIQTMIQMGLKLDTNVQSIIFEHYHPNLETILKKIVQMSGISMPYYERQKKRKDTPVLYNDFVQVKSHSEEKTSLLQILEKMDMLEYYPEKLSIQEALQMHEHQFTEPSTFSELPWAMLRKIIAMNFEFREKTLHDLLRQLDPHSESKSKKDKRTRQLISSRKPRNNPTSQLYHPSDVFLALFQCLDPFLKTLVAQKMQVCQVAVPLIYKDHDRELQRFSLWPLREIFIDGSSGSVATKQIGILSFVRIGDKGKGSKSKLINQFLRDQNDEHSTFFHKDCLLGYQKRAFTSGTIETSWFIPKSRTGNDQEVKDREKETAIEWPLTILNLRGDAFSFPEQLHFLLNFTNVLVLIADYEDLKCQKHCPLLTKIHASGVHVIIVTGLPHDEDETEQFINFYEEKTKMSRDKCSIISTTSEGRFLNEIEIKQCLVHDIYDAFEEQTLYLSLEEISEQLPSTFYCDEELSKSLEGRQLCDQLASKLENKQLQQKLEKKDILPLQSEALWHEWSKQQKEENRSGKKEKLYANKSHFEKMLILRVKQVCAFGQFSDTMAMFVDILETYKSDEKTTLFFLSWLRQYMDNRSKSILPEHLDRLKQAFHEFESFRSLRRSEINPENDKDLETLRTKISEEEKNLAQSSFGLEHFFREMGQIYEAFMYLESEVSCTITTKTREVIKSLPAVAAKLLLWGQPLEIMDGDAANVPMMWINAVFNEVAKSIGENKRVFAISVLGIQSSGKSTLLNTMFGLQFAVSAGRCTRGIFIQLVPVDKNKSSLKFDFAMVIDTEGLRAPELSGEKVNHDNELATLVIGMGDIVIINIKGETIADMEGVLQIVVHALIRLKQANEKITLQQSCIFVHQNVSALDAEKLTIQGNQKIVQNLDKITVEVANQEHVVNIGSFQDVIGFNPMNPVKYVPDLWHGSPPMAPASLQYSTRVIEVAKCIIQDLTTNKIHNYLSIKGTRDHLQNLWNGILSENFVFSFRNVLEVKAYSLLEKKFQELTWQLEELKLKWLNDSVRPTLKQCKNCDELENQEKTIYEQFFKRINEKTKLITEELDLFFKESDFTEHMVHWKGRKYAELEMISRSIENDVKHKLHSEKEKCKALLESNDSILKNKKEIQKKAKEFAETLIGRQETPSVNEIQMEFNRAWKQWVDEIVRRNPERHVDVDIGKMTDEIVQQLYYRFEKHDNLVEDGLKDQSIEEWKHFNSLVKTISVQDVIPSRHISILTLWGTVKGMAGLQNYEMKAYNYINDIFIRIDAYVNNLQADTEYDPTIFSRILKFVTDAFEEHFKDSAKHGYTMRPLLEVKVALHVARFSVYHFSEMIKTFKLKNSLRSRVESSRQETEILFIGICTAKANEVIVCNVFCLEMKPLIQEKIERELSVHIPKEIAHLFEYRKYPLMKAILENLAKQNDFEKYMQYVSCCEAYTMTWITKFTKTHFKKNVGKENTLYSIFAIDVLRILIRDIKSSVEKASSAFDSPTSIAEWIRNFRDYMKKHNLNFSSEPFNAIKNLRISDFKNLASLIQDRIDAIEKELSEVFQKSNVESVAWKDPTPYQVIMDKLWGCPQTCPWCSEPCSTASKDDNHKHRCIQHRPQGVNGYQESKSRKIVLKSCNYLITIDKNVQCGNWCNCSSKDPSVFHPCKEYKKYMPTWDITPSSDISKYWTWFIGKFGDRLADHHGIILSDVPKDWKNLTKEDAILSLSEYE